MMSIDEAIAKYKEITNTDENCPIHCMRSCDKCVQESGQLAEWLEELKELRELKDTITSNAEVLERQGYNEAIDDFVQLVKEHNWHIRNRNENEFIYGAIDKLSEQLKAGERDEF